MKKIRNSLIVIMSIFALTFGMIPSGVANAQEPNEESDFKITDHVVTDNKESFTIAMNGEEVDYKSTKTEDSFEIETVEENNEVHTFTYTKGDDYMMIDGEKVSVEIDTEVEAELTDSSAPKLLKASAWTPKYMSTGSIKISKSVKTLGTLVGVIGGAISIAALSGVAIATSTIASTVGHWASAVGLGTIAAGYAFNGKVQFKQYRTTGLVPTNYGKRLYAFRFQDVRVIGTLKGKKIDKQLKNVGNWFFNSKPY
ncbi:TPA: hypothetical protein MPW84_001290 [Listeria monocytogenes]|uniref:Uncharacterized protein n=1 Tax=Listeria monocytogenes TaxID=1639 RepID=A0A3T1TDY4_LISMN|nr:MULTISPECIES: hypothetical protein [Listeria]EAF3064103.1 hypothetical protein [Listeria monocytogenes serotype 1/2a]AGR03377.1 hypothetical protein M642_14955 [Listeria monocytogenes]ARJ77208.1 hypothetical protein UL92_02450 [Listeria monocytogenes]AVI17156.1 hypothetical protein C4881_00303 [Listeria monocytogenes]AZU52309.1 Hypothetical protein FORC57_0468 [Listeria monocytogenes]